MKEETKEILDRAKNLKYKCDCCEEIAPGKYVMRNDKQTDNLIEAVYIIDKLLDYITNLQEENERLRKNQKLTPEQRQHLHLEFEELFEIYKKRIDKAIELLKYDMEYVDLEDGYYTCEKLLNILQGEDTK